MRRRQRAPDWPEILRKLGSSIQLNEPATPAEIEALEGSVGTLDLALRTLLMITNGVGIAKDVGVRLVWRVDRIVSENHEFRTRADFGRIYMPFDNLMFFGDMGNGDQFALPIHRDGTMRCDVFVWDHETDSRRWAAPSVDQYLDWWVSGRMKT